MTERVLLLGHEIAYSASPPMLNAAFAASRLAIRYELCDVDVEALEDAVRLLRSADAIGANVTKPHKLAVLDLVDECDDSAVRAGSANVIARREERLVAYSTDLPAIREELQALGPAGRGRAVILGDGGVARAVARALDELGWPEVVTIARANWADMRSALSAADLVVNATPLGTNGTASPVPADAHRPALAVLDLVYRPSPTRLVADALERGARARAGAGVLLRQAALGFTLWTGRPAPLDAMRQALRAELGAGADV